MTSSALALSPDLPSWATLVVPHVTFQTVGINSDGKMYLWGDTAQKPGPPVPSVTGYIAGIGISFKGATSPHGAREYLDLRMNGLEPGTGFVLSPSCGRIDRDSGSWETSCAVRSLLGCITQIDLTATVVTLLAKKGTKGRKGVPTFVNAFTHGPQEGSLVEVDSPSIAKDRDSFEIAVNRVRSLLGQPALFDELTAVADTMETTSYSPDDF